MLRAVLPGRGELLRKAIEWQALLESGKVASQAEIASREGVKIFTSPGTLHGRTVTERMLRPIGDIANQDEQIQEFNRLSV